MSPHITQSNSASMSNCPLVTQHEPSQSKDKAQETMYKADSDDNILYTVSLFKHIPHIALNIQGQNKIVTRIPTPPYG